MNLLGQIIDTLRPKSSESHPARNPVQILIDEGQQAKRAEEYGQALALLDEAERQAEDRSDYGALAAIALQRAAALIALERWTEAEGILLRARRDAQNKGLRTHLAYTLSTLGMLEQGRQNQEEARAYYEQALKVARAAGSPGGEGRAMAHLADTYLAEQNASYAVHLLQEALPKLNLNGDIELSSYFVGLLGEGLIQTGQEAEGEHLLYRALRIAEQMKYRKFERRWALALGRRASRDRRYEEALRLYRQALALFKGESAARVETCCEASRACLYLGHPEEALDFVQKAMAAASADSDQQRLARGVLGMALRASNRNEEAVPHLEFAVGALGPNAESMALDIMRCLAAAQADRGHLEAARTLYQRVLMMTGGAPLETAQTHLELGLLYQRHHNLQAALDQWRSALAIYENERAFGQAARLYCDIGGARRFLGQGQRAMRDYDQALMMLNSVDDPFTRGVVISNAAIAHAEMGDAATAEAFFNEAIDIANRLGDRRAEATRRGNYGWFLLSTGHPQRAIVTVEQALRLSQQEDLSLQAAIQTDTLGLAYDTLRDYDRALNYHRQALEKIRSLDDPHWENIIKINLGNTLLRLSQFEEARPLFLEALTLGRAQSDVEIVVRALIGQARLALGEDQAISAGDLLQEAIKLARQGDMRRQLAEALQIHSQQQAVVNEMARSNSLWDEARKLFRILQMPQADLEPEWLRNDPVEP